MHLRKIKNILTSSFVIAGIAFVFVIAFTASFSFSRPHEAQAATTVFSLYPQNGTVKVGSIVPVAIFISSPRDAVNAVSATLSFPPDALEVVSLDTTHSVLNLWVEQPTFSNENGTIRFGGVAFNPGFKGSSGRIITIRFRIRAPGQALIRFVSSLVLANDGHGTELNTDAHATAIFTAAVGGAPDAVNTIDASGSGNEVTLTPPAPLSPQSSSTQMIIVILVSCILVLVAYGVYNVKKLQYDRPGNGMSEHDLETLKKLKKDLDAAEAAVDEKIKHLK